MLQFVFWEGGFEQGFRIPASQALTNPCSQQHATWEQDHPFHQRVNTQTNRLCIPTQPFCHPT